MKITSDGQVTVPQEMRERYGLHPATEVEFATRADGVVIRPAQTRKRQLREWIARARGCATVKITTDEVMRMTRGEETLSS